MKISINKKIGQSTLTFYVEEEKEIDVLARASFYATTPDKCNLCNSDDIVLDSNRSKGFIFVKIKCLKCNARANMGQFKDGSGCFWKEWEKYIPPLQKENNNNE